MLRALKYLTSHRSLLSLLTALTALTFLTPLTAQELQKIGHLSYSPRLLSGCWHHVDSSGGEWALIGTNKGLSIVDLEDPTEPFERFLIPGTTNHWRELRTWGGYAYVGSEAIGSGITIIDLRGLPNAIRWKVWRGDGVYDSLIIKSHTLQTADGYLYIFGGSNVTNGAVIADLSDPWNPVIRGTYTTNYVHDGYIRGDTMWTSEIYKGWFGVVDISDKANPVLLATQPTPGAFNHNTGLSDDGTLLFTTDEKPLAPLGVFDVSNLEDIRMLDTYLPSKKPAGEVHNVRVLHDFLICPSYRGQLTLVDASRPANLVETAWDSLGTSLVWDADPYLPSGIILATAKVEGLFIYQKPSYRHAAWLEGRTTDGATGFPLPGVKVFVVGTLFADTSGSDGIYGTGVPNTGTYDVYAFREGYGPVVKSQVQLQNNVVTNLDIQLFPASGTQNIENQSSMKLAPSPFENYITVEFTENSTFYNTTNYLRLIDAKGKVVAETISLPGANTSLQGLSHLPAAPYWLWVTNPEGGVLSRIVIKD